MSPDTVVLREAERDDLAELLELYRTLNPADRDMSAEEADTAFAAILAQPGLSIFLATDGEDAVATATLQIVPNLTRAARPYALTENVVTRENRRGRGYGRAVVRHAVEAAFAANCYKVMLLTGRQIPRFTPFTKAAASCRTRRGFRSGRSDVHSSGSVVNISGNPASLPRSVASLAFVSAISRSQTTTTALPKRCAVIITR
ncbi:Acetyltransferase [Agrobacterium tumefaciens]|nr:Acetyltransferase [Agrobacterium tumefaciens]